MATTVDYRDCAFKGINELVLLEELKKTSEGKVSQVALNDGCGCILAAMCFV